MKFIVSQSKKEEHDLVKVAVLDWTCWEMTIQFINHYSKDPLTLCLALEYSSKIGNIENVKYLVEVIRVDVNFANRYGETAVWIACRFGQFEIMKYLIENTNIDFNQADSEYQTPLSIACCCGYFDIMKYLIEEAGVDLNDVHSLDSPSPLFSACLGGNFEIIKYLVNEKYLDLYQTDYHGDTPFQIVCCFGHLEIVQFFLEKVETDVISLLDKLDQDGNTSMMTACRNNHVEVVKYLVNKRWSVRKEGFLEWLNTKNLLDQTVLDISRQLTKMDLTRFLMEKGAKSVWHCGVEIKMFE